MARFSSKDFTVVALIFRSLIHFGLLFVLGEVEPVQLHPFACGYPVDPAQSVEKTVQLTCFDILVRNQSQMCLFLHSQFCSSICLSL